MEPRISTKLRETNLAKLRKTKLLTHERKLRTCYAKTGTWNPGSQQSRQNQSSKVEKNKTTDTDEKHPNPLRKDGDTEPGMSTKLAQNQSSKVEENKTTDT